MMGLAFRSRLSDVLASLRHVPDSRGWGRAGLELCWAVPLLLLAGLAGGLVRFQTPPDIATSALIAMTLFLVPAFGEELLFRGLAIPRGRRSPRWIAFSVVLFVLWHPLQAVTFGPPWASSFLDFWFLAAVAILGLALARIYVATQSLWPCIVAHWLVVFGWKAVLGGPF